MKIGRITSNVRTTWAKKLAIPEPNWSTTHSIAVKVNIMHGYVGTRPACAAIVIDDRQNFDVTGERMDESQDKIDFAYNEGEIEGNSCSES